MAEPPDLVADLLQDVRAALAHLQAVEQRLEALLPIAPTATDEGDEVENDLEPLLDSFSASQRFQCPADTLRKWAREENCGVRRGGRWLISVPRVKRRLGL